MSSPALRAFCLHTILVTLRELAPEFESSEGQLSPDARVIVDLILTHGLFGELHHWAEQWGFEHSEVVLKNFEQRVKAEASGSDSDALETLSS